MNIQQQDQQYVAHTYKRFPVTIVEGKGSVVIDDNGKKYIDLGSGIGVTSFGIGDDIWKKAVISQLNLVQHTSNLYYTEPCSKLARLLCEKTDMKKVFFSNSGAEANECAIKVARKYSAEKKGSEYSVIITLKNSFHGRTLTTLAATGQDKFHELFQPLTPGFVYVDANNKNEIAEAVEKYNIAGILLECIQGEGGVIPLDEDYLNFVQSLCSVNDIPLMIDEVQTGNGRTGAMYAYMNYHLIPDIVSTAKGLGGGLPLGATLLGNKVQDVLGYGDHGSTFGGNPVACAGGISVVERLTDEFLAEVRKKSIRFIKAINEISDVESITGAGLMLGIETKAPASDVVNACIEKGVLCLTAKNKVRILPALNIPEDVLMDAAEKIKQAIATV